MERACDSIEVVVREIRVESPDVRSFVLDHPEGAALPAYSAGAHIEVEPVPGLVRQYSLLGDPAEAGPYRIGVKREPQSRGGSVAMHSALRVGSRLRIGLPRNNFALMPPSSGGRRLLLAGGIGVTPLLSMAAALYREGADFDLHYFVRTGADLAFQGVISDSGWGDRTFFHLGLEPRELAEFLPVLLEGPGPGDQIYMCGPPGFMDLVREVAEPAGWPAERIFCEHFIGPPTTLPVEGDSFVVRLASSDRDYVVPADKSIVDVLRDAGVEVITNCEQGICGTCVTRCLEGEPDHRDLYLTDEEHEGEHLFAPCVSRAKSRLLVLDL